MTSSRSRIAREWCLRRFWSGYAYKRHALATAYKLREAGQKMTDAAIIDAYERAYNVAQAVGADHREPELPPMRDRLTMARRVRGYVLSGKRRTGTGTPLG